MSSRIDETMLRAMLKALEHVLDSVDRVSDTASRLVSAQKGGPPLSPATLEHYDEQLGALDLQRAEIRDVIARWWRLVEVGTESSST